ncbi:MAG: membrane fusion protein (multidrug efflux system) [Oceanicoccus sp.]|jgi:membrane fusion protein (multidrug efflux system)
MNFRVTKFAIPVITIIAILVVVAWFGGAFTNKVSPGVTTVKEETLPSVVIVIERKQPLFEPVPATIKAKQTTIISSRILSRIEKIHVSAGARVNKGQLLIELEKEELLSRASQAMAAINTVKAHLLEAKLSFERALELSRSGVISKADMENAQARHDALTAELVTAQQGLKEAEAALSFGQIHAPINGRIVDRFAEPGDTVQPGAQLLILYNPVSLRVEANVRERLALSLSVDQPLKVNIPALDTELMSEIEELVPAGNSGSRSFLVKSRLKYSEGLLPGMYAQLLVPAGEESLLLIPAERVAKVGQLDIVWLDSDGVSERRFVRTGKHVGDGLLEVISGLQKGDRLLSVPN